MLFALFFGRSVLPVLRILKISAPYFQETSAARVASEDIARSSSPVQRHIEIHIPPQVLTSDYSALYPST